MLFFIIATLLTTSVAFANILDGAEEFKGHYYKTFEFETSWDDAKVFCESVGGHLATIGSQEEHLFVIEVCKKGSKWPGKYWLGGYRNSKGIWKWIDGTVISLNNWERGYPDSSAFSNTISMLYGKWWSVNNTYTYGFVCEWESLTFAHETNW